MSEIQFSVYPEIRAYVEEYPHDERELKAISLNGEIVGGEYYKYGTISEDTLLSILRYPERLSYNGRPITGISLQPARSDLDTLEDAIEVWIHATDTEAASKIDTQEDY